MMDALALYVTTLIPQFFSDSSRSAQNAVENMTLPLLLLLLRLIALLL